MHRMAKPNPHFNSYRGVLVNIPPDNGNPTLPHNYDHTCLCDACKTHERSLAYRIVRDSEPFPLPIR